MQLISCSILVKEEIVKHLINGLKMLPGLILLGGGMLAIIYLLVSAMARITS